MYEEDKDPVDAANEFVEKKRQDEATKQAETLEKMEQNRIEDEKQKQKIMAIASICAEVNKPIVADLKEQRTQIEYLGLELQKTNEAVNKIISLLNPNASNPAITDQNAKMAQAVGILEHPVVGKFIDKLADKLLAPEQTGIQPLISQDIINQKMTKAFMDDLDTGESIRTFITDALKKKATKKVIKQSLGQIGNVEHISE